jgi:hypothetical protein
LLVQGPTVQQTNDRIVNDFMARIAGHEREPAEKVFKNVQWLKGVPAGVTCAHCHPSCGR